MTDITIDAGSLSDFLQVTWDMWVRDNMPTVTDQVAARAPRKTGALASSHTWRRVGVDAVELVATAEHAASVHQGHGTIRPKSPGGFVTAPGSGSRRAAPPAGFLRFSVGGRTIYAHEVGPVAGNPWMIEALRALGFDVSAI